MSFPKTLLFGSIALFSLIGVISFFKSDRKKIKETKPIANEEIVQEIVINPDDKTMAKVVEPISEEKIEKNIPKIDRVDHLFALDSSKFNFMETITYTSRVPWLKGRPAWIADYASFYQTSRHFIARSLNKKRDYYTQNVNLGDKFNVFRKDINLSFYLLIDLNLAKMKFYAYDATSDVRYLIKTFSVGLGRKDANKPSGCLTPKGTFTLGNKIAIYKPGSMGYFQDRKIEMMRVFGTRWIPFQDEEKENSEDVKGYGLHGAPWITDSSGQLLEDRDKIGKYDSDGCIRLASEDIEEIFSIVITKPTIVQLVNDFQEADLPGSKEK